MSAHSPLEIPVWKSVDVLVLGSTLASITAALAAAKNGVTTAVVAEDTYFGSDLAGTYQMWRESGIEKDAFLQSLFAEEQTLRPLVIKASLESLLLEAEIPFLFACRPVQILRDASGVLGAVVFAFRSSLFAVRCKEVVDASFFGCLLPLDSSVEMAGRAGGSPPELRVFTAGVPELPGVLVEALLPTHRQKPTERDEEADYPAFALKFSPLGDPSDPATLKHSLLARCVDEKIGSVADYPIWNGSRQLARAGSRGLVVSPGADDLSAAPNLWCANRLLPCDGERASNSVFWCNVGTLAGNSAAAEAARRSGHHFKSSLECVREDGREFLESGVLGFSTGWFRNCRETLPLHGLAFSEENSHRFDVVVVGGGTGGVPAAILSSRRGASTLCLEATGGFGGVGTTGLISSYWFGNKCGFTQELDARVCAVDARSRAKSGNVWNPVVKTCIYHQMLEESGGAAWMHSFVFGVRNHGERPDAVLVSTPFGSRLVKASVFVDATGNADVAAAAGARCRVIDHRHVAVQGTGISPKYFPTLPSQNSDHTFVDENDVEGRSAAFVQARRKFSGAFDLAPFVNSRERRQILGEVEISPLDLLAGRKFPDTVVTARSNFDTHGFVIHPVFLVTPPDHAPLSANVPLRCMLPEGLEGILVTGLGMSAHRDALPVVRMQADVQNQGAAAGILAAKAALSGVALRDIPVTWLQEELLQEKILKSSEAFQSDSFPIPEDEVRKAADGTLESAKDIAVLFAHPEQAMRFLVERLEAWAGDSEMMESVFRAALVLGFLGHAPAGGVLRGFLADREWDEGWNFRGMGQFGSSMSRMDVAVLALVKSGASGAGEVCCQLAGRLPADPAFSHCRALAIAAGDLKYPPLQKKLAGLLELPGVSGHACRTVTEVLRDSDPDPTSTTARNLSLRELHLARGLYLGGDLDDRGRRILEEYAEDLRGHYALHARALLALSPGTAEKPPASFW